MDAHTTTAALPKRSPLEIQRAVLFALFQRELKARLGGRWLGAFWILLEPVAHVALMMLLLVYVRHRLVPGIPTPLFLVTGVIPFIIFRNISLRVMGSVDANRGLFGYRQVKPIDPLLARALLEIVLYSCVYVLFLAGLGWFLDIQWFPALPLELIGVSAILIALGIGIGLILVVATDDVPQLRVFVRILYMPLYLLSGVIFPVHNFPSHVVDWLAWNPLLHLLEYSRHYFAPHYPLIPQADLAYPAWLALLALALGLSLYRVRRDRLLAH